MTMKYDYDFRPETYWSANAVTVNIAGQWRRERIRQAMSEGTLDSLPAEIFHDHLKGAEAETGSVPDKLQAFAGLLSGSIMDERAMAGMFSPGGLGGEYLPSYADGEVEIARVVIASTTTDVVSIRAREIDGWIAYSIADEYQFEYELSQWFSRKPISFGEFLCLLNDSCSRQHPDFIGGLVLGAANFGYINSTGERTKYFRFALVESEFYPEIGSWIDELWEDWLRTRWADDEHDDREVSVRDGQWDGIPNKKYKSNPVQRPYVMEVVEAFVSKLHCLVANTIGQAFIENLLRSGEQQANQIYAPFSDHIQETKIEILDEMGIQTIILEAAKRWESAHDSQLDLESLGGYDLYTDFGSDDDYWKWSSDGEEDVFDSLFEKAKAAVG
jgi:hypothetical protein